MKKYLFYASFLFCCKLISNNLDPISIYKHQLEFCELLKDPKAVASCKNNVLLLAAAHNQQINQSKQNQQQNNNLSNQQANQTTQKSDNTAEILSNFSNVVQSLGKIAADRHNPANVGESICNMIAGMINIAATMTRRMPVFQDDESDKETEIDQNSPKDGEPEKLQTQVQQNETK
jgi:hypothetical protein